MSKFVLLPIIFIFTVSAFYYAYNHSFQKDNTTLTKPISSSNVIQKNGSSTIKDIDKNIAFKELCEEYPKMYLARNSNIDNTIFSNSIYGYIATDGYSITHIYDANQGKFIPLQPPELFGTTTKERIINSLNRLLNAQTILTVKGKATLVSNFSQIDKVDIDLYAKTNMDTGSKSFKFIYNSKKEPILVIAIKTIPSKDLKTMFNSLQKAVDIIEKYDPKILDKISTEYFVRIITGPLANINPDTESFKAIPTVGAIVYIPSKIGADYLLYIYSLISESRYIGNFRSSRRVAVNNYEFYLTDNLDKSNVLKDRSLWINNWILSHKDDIFKNNYQHYINMGDIYLK